MTTTQNANYFEITTDDENLGDVCSDETIDIDATTLLNGDSASNGSTLEVQEVNLVNSADGTIVANNDGTWTFTPASGVTGNVALKGTRPSWASKEKIFSSVPESEIRAKEIASLWVMIWVVFAVVLNAVSKSAVLDK